VKKYDNIAIFFSISSEPLLMHERKYGGM